MEALLERRLDRFRANARSTVAALRPVVADHATPLAEALGGRVVRSNGGAIVAIEEAFAVPFDAAVLTSLPYPLEPSRPLICVDLETTGLATAAGTLAFLVGVGVWRSGTLSVNQLVLPDHSGEETLLAVLAELIPPDGWLVTYNGKGFDWPLVTARYRMHRRAPPPHAGHLDLLPVARQLWKHRLGGARLSLVEAEICQVRREHDLPGELIPDRYFSYLRTRRPELLRDVVLHNRQDIVSMAQLLGVLAATVCSPSEWHRLHPGDLFGLARSLARRGRAGDALEVVEGALRSRAWSAGVADAAQLHRRLSADRARLLRRVGRREDSYAAWLAIAKRGGPGAGVAWLHVARYREHVMRDIEGALIACRESLAITERARAWGAPLVAVEQDLSHRLPRLRRRAFSLRSRAGGGVGRAA